MDSSLRWEDTPHVTLARMCMEDEMPVWCTVDGLTARRDM